MKNRIDDIEALRAIAVFAVIFHHVNTDLVTWKTTFTDYQTVYFGGWVGVDLFFAISGFVIARTLVPRLDAVKSNAEFLAESLSFWVRRCYRLLPSAWLWLSITLILVVTFNDHGIFGTFRDNWQSTIAAFLNVMNFHFAEIFGQGGKISNFVYWSLSLEEQFYLLLPLVIFVSRKWFLYLVIAAFIYKIVTPLAPMGMPFRSHAILGGVLLAMWSNHPSYQLARPALLGSSFFAKYFTAFMLLVCLFTLGSDTLLVTRWRISLIAIVSLILVYIASFNGDYLIPRQKLVRAFALWAGSRSYTLYLTHIPGFFTARELCLRLSESVEGFQALYKPAVIIIAFLLILIATEVNYRFVETPIRKRGVTAAANIRAKFEKMEASTE